MAGRTVRVFLVLAAVAASLGAPCPVSAQAIEACDAAWLDADHVRAILQVELADRWDPAFDAIVVRVEACDTELPRVSLIAPDHEPTAVTLRLGAVAPRARTRFVALIVAELLRARAVAPPDAGRASGPSGPVAIASAPPAPPESIAPEPIAPSAAAPTIEPEPFARSISVASEPLARSASLASPGASRAGPATDPAALDAAPSPDPALLATVPGRSALALAAPSVPAPGASTATPPRSPWRLAVSFSARVFAPPVVPAAHGDVTLRYDRLLLAIAAGGTELGSPAGVARMAQLTVGVGVRLLEHVGSVRVGWDLRGDAGAAVSGGDPSDPTVVGRVTFTYVLAASTQLEVVWPAGPVELGFVTDLGYQRGIVELGPFAQGGLGGAFISFGGTVAWSL